MEFAVIGIPCLGLKRRPEIHTQRVLLVTPRSLMEAIADPDPAAAKRAFEALSPMRKIDIAAIEAARRG